MSQDTLHPNGTTSSFRIVANGKEVMSGESYFGSSETGSKYGIVKDGTTYVGIKAICEILGISLDSERENGILTLYVGGKPVPAEEPPVETEQPETPVEEPPVVQEPAQPEEQPEPPQEQAPEEQVEGDEPDESAPVAEQPPAIYETTVLYGVNFRNAPDTSSYVYRMIPKGEKIHVVREVDANWLQVEVKDKTVGYVSSNPKYTSYGSKSDRDKKADDLIAFGSKFMGNDYKFGAKIGEVDAQGKQLFDCSLLVQYCFKEVLGISLPRASYNQAAKGTEIQRSDLRPGDVVFFTSRGLPIGHVAIYIGNNRILQTYSSKSGGVRIDQMTGQWDTRFAKAVNFF